ncbi:MAG: TonB-dependent receptor [Bacteroidales bacterium]|nr:TonB-dependent receptor [Bacteroidales bacterium]
MDASGRPLAGVIIQNLKNQSVTSTDSEGKYSITADQGQNLEFACLGLKTVTSTVTQNSTVLNITMEEDAEYLEEVVVVGYGTTKKRDLAGSVASIKTENVKAGVISSPAEVLRGRAAGVYVHQASFEPGGGISVRVRGASSISSENEPLYVIDGLQCDNATNVSPQDIESIEILKDAASTSIYGARGANGVVIITTKSGTEGNLNISYGSDISVKVLKNPYSLMNGAEKIKYDMQVWEQNGSVGVAPYTEEEQKYTGEGTNWLKEMTHPAVTQRHALSITGGNKFVKVAASLNYYDDNGILKNTNFSRLDGRVNADFVISKYIRAGVKAFKSVGKKDYLKMNLSASTDNVMYWMFLADPLKSMDGATDVLGREGNKPETVYFELQNKQQNNATDNSYATFYTEADLFKGFTAKVQYSFNTTDTKMRNYYSKETVLGQSVNGRGLVDNESSDTRQLDAVLTYHNSFSDLHDLKIIAGSSYITNKYESNGMDAQDFSTDAFSYNNMGAASVINGIYTSLTKKTNLSFFGRLEYKLMDKYIINASIRADGASNFGTGKKWGYFPSVSGAWQIGDESWMEGAKPVLSGLKLRASWGMTGNDGIGRYKSLKTYSFNDVYIGGDGIVKGMYLQNAGNVNLCWETTSQLDFGLDFSLFKDKLTGAFDWYNKVTTDLLNDINISASSVGLTSTTGNSGSVLNRGWEFSLKYNAIDKVHTYWETILNLSGNRNELLSIESPTYFTMRPHGSYETREYMAIQEGQSLSSIYGYVWDGIIQEGETVATMPKAQPGDPKFVDINNDGIIDDNDRKVIGKGTPDVVIGWSNNFRIYNFDLSFFFNASIGNQLLNVSKVLLEDENRLSSCMNRWTKENPSTTMIRTIWQKKGDLQYGSFVNSHYVEDASFLRLSNIEVGYNLPLRKWESKVVKACRFYLGAQNLFVLTKYSGFDPEVSSNGAQSAVLQGLDYATYPAYRTFNAGVKITF